jgi:3,4-dihydroxy 2-butanone 4-phosphate synthase/GTP cyclohydrolase II
MELSTIDQALDALRAGKPVLVADADDRENEGDAIISAELASAEWIAWMVKHTTGFLCVPMEESRANHLELPVMTVQNRDPHSTNYTITVDATNRISTGVSAADRANTAHVLADPLSMPSDLIRPGHMLPLLTS